MWKFFLIPVFIGCLSFSAFADTHDHDHDHDGPGHAETAISDMIEAATVASNLYTDPADAALAFETSRIDTDGIRYGVAVKLLYKENDLVKYRAFGCPYDEDGTEITGCAKQKKQKRKADEPVPATPYTILIKAAAALAEAAPEAGLPLAAITFLKSWKGRAPVRSNPIYFVRASYASANPQVGSGNAVFSCHMGAHGNDSNKMDCHFNSANPVGPDEPQVLEQN